MEDQGPPFIDNPLAPEVFAFRVAGVGFFGGNIHLTFESPKLNHGTTPPTLTRIAVGRLIIPLQAAEELRDLLADYLPKVKAGQTAPQAPPAGTPLH